MDQISLSMQSLNIDDDDDLLELEEILNYGFNDKSLLEEAITHSSMNSTKSYQRLELLGDSVLGYLVTKHLHSTYPELDEGNLTLLRSRNVSNERFARVSVKHKLHQYLRLKQPDLQLLIGNFVDASEDESQSTSSRSGEFKPPKVLADIVESIAGAVLVDSGHSVDQVWEVFKPLLEPLLEPPVIRETLEMHPTDELKEICQKHGKRLEYRYTWRGNVVTVKICINGRVVGCGKHEQEELAQRTANEQAVDKLMDMLKEEDRLENARRHEKGKNGALISFCIKNHWPSPDYRLVQENPSSYARRFVCAVSVCTDRGRTEEYVGNPMPRIREAKNSAAKAILDALKC